ncbi:MAG: hypothetical protein IJH85_03190 [Clostridia bacterium]|nr:hypothetical protein [Clostridia bacterium]
MNQPDCFPQAGDVENTGFMKNKKPESIDLQAFRLFHRPCGNCLTPCGKTVENSSVICIFSIFRIFSQLRKRKIRFEERIIHSNVFKRFILIFSGMSCILRKRNVHITVFIKGQEDAVPDTGHGQYLCCAATGDPGIFHDDFRTMKIMHWNEQTGFYGQNEVICSGLKHASLPWIDRKKGNINVFFLQGTNSGLEFPFSLFNFLKAGFLTPVPEIQIAGMKNPDSLQIQKKRYAEIRAVKSGYEDSFLQLQGITGSHAFSTGTDGHIRRNIVGYGCIILPGENNRIQMIHMFMGNKNVYSSVLLQFFRQQLKMIMQFLMFSSPVIKNKKEIFGFY